MLSNIALADAATTSRERSRTGALLLGGCAAVSRARVQESAVIRTAAAHAAVTALRPQAGADSVLSGSATHAANQAKFALQQPTSQKYAQTTRIAIEGGGALGPPQARDPV